MASPGGPRHAPAVVKGGVNLPAAAAAAAGRSADQYCANSEEWALNVRRPERSGPEQVRMWSVDTGLPRMHQFTVSSVKLFDVHCLFSFYSNFKCCQRRESLTPFEVLMIRGEHQSRRPSRRLTFMFNGGDDHKGGDANVPFTVHPQLISDPTQGWRAPGEHREGGGGAAATALRCHGGCGVLSQAERGDDKGRELGP